MKKLIYTSNLGVLWAVALQGWARQLEGETEQAWIARVAAKTVPRDATNVRLVEAEALPNDRTFRNAWTANGGVVAVDMPKARELKKDTLRRLREPLLKALDVEYQRADEAKDDAKKSEIAAKKQALRDVTEDPAIAAAATPDELKAVLPDIVKGAAADDVSTRADLR